MRRGFEVAGLLETHGSMMATNPVDHDIPGAPVRYSPDVEQIAPDEADTIRELSETMRSISETTFKNAGHPLRSVHAKSHGVLTGEFAVLDNLPKAYAQGLFATPRSYPAALRFSTSPGDIMDDSVSTPRGLAIKVIGVDGERVAGSQSERTQDFVMVNGPAFLAPTPKKFLGSLKLLAKTTDKGEGVKKLISAALRATEAAIEALGGKSPTLTSLGGQRETHILGETFFSQVPVRYGDCIAKISVAPVSLELTRLIDAPLDYDGNPNALRDAVIAFFKQHGGVWEVRVQLCTDIETMPVEDASVVWPEDKSPYVAVARLTVPMQDAWAQPTVERVNEGLSFSPWHALAAHQPLGGIMRARRPVYRMSADFRASHGSPVAEPKTREDIPA